MALRPHTLEPAAQYVRWQSSLFIAWVIVL